MLDGSVSRAKQAQLFVAVFVGSALALRLGLTVFAPDADQDPDLLVRLERFVSYFTIQSNFAVLLAALAVLRVENLETAFMRALRIAAMVGITVTSIVYILILSGDAENSGLSQLANLMLHYVGPPLAVGAWVSFGPFQRYVWSDVWRVLVWPGLWIAWTLVHGAVTDWYPYGFIDVASKGYGPVIVNIAVITVFASALAVVYIGAGRWRGRSDARV